MTIHLLLTSAFLMLQLLIQDLTVVDVFINFTKAAGEGDTQGSY